MDEYNLRRGHRISVFGRKSTAIIRRLVNIYEKSALDVSTLRRLVRLINMANGNPRRKEADLSDRDRPASAVNMDMAKQVNALITAYKRITTSKLSEMLLVSHDVGHSLIATPKSLQSKFI